MVTFETLISQPVMNICENENLMHFDQHFIKSTDHRVVNNVDQIIINQREELCILA